MSKAADLRAYGRIIDELRAEIEGKDSKIDHLVIDIAQLTTETTIAQIRAARAEGELVALRATLAMLESERRWAELEQTKMRLEVKVSDLERELRQQWTQALAVQMSPSPERKKS